jgi:type II secretion system protein N
VALIATVAVVALTLFAAFLTANFPYKETASAMLAPYQLKLVYHAHHPRLPFGVRLEDASVIALADGSNHPLVNSPEISLMPSLSSILLGKPGLNISAELYAGTFAATIRQNAGAVDLDFSLKTLNLAECIPLQRFGPVFGGNLSGTGSAAIRGPAISDNAGATTIDGRDVTLEITRGFPLIHLGFVSGRLLLDSGVVTFQDLESHGGDLEARANGEIQLVPNLADSTIAARIYLTPTASGQAHFGLFFKMLPHPPTEGPYDLRGPLYSPSLN